MILETVLTVLSGAGEIANSPFIVPVAGCLMIVGIVGFTSWSGARSRECESHERLAAIAKGIAPPPTKEEIALTHARPTPSALRRRANVRLSGIVLVGTAFGLMLFFALLAWVLRERDVLCGVAVGLIPLGIGIAFLIDAGIQARELAASASSPEGSTSLSSF